MNKVFILILLCFPFLANAELLDCGPSDVERLMVHGDREGTHGHENTLLVTLSNNGSDIMCSGKNYMFIENTDPAYSGILSVLLSAQVSGKQVNVFVNTTVVTGGNAVEIAFVALKK